MLRASREVRSILRRERSIFRLVVAPEEALLLLWIALILIGRNTHGNHYRIPV